MESVHSKLLAAGTGTAAVLGFSYLWYTKKSRERVSIPVARVTSLFFYPVTSCGGIRVDEARCTPRGIELNGVGDRTFLIVEPDGTKVNGKTEPWLVSIQPKLDEPGFLTLDAPGMPSLRLDLADRCSKASRLTVDVYEMDRVEALDMGPEASDWISRYLLESGSKVKKAHLVYHPWKKSQRKQHEFKASLNALKPDHHAHFAYMSSFHVVNEGSVVALNEELQDKGYPEATARNFRPNIVVDHCPPFAEEAWGRFRINDMIFSPVIPATRCTFVNVNPDTGKVRPDHQPYVLLRKFHTLKEDTIPKHAKQGDPVMGTFVSSDDSGLISVGDTVFAIF